MATITSEGVIPVVLPTGMSYLYNTSYPDRAPLKEVLGGQYNYREGGGKCCGKALKAAGGVEVVDVIRIRAPKK